MAMSGMCGVGKKHTMQSERLRNAHDVIAMAAPDPMTLGNVYLSRLQTLSKRNQKGVILF
jgi:hypothetical protein